MDPRVRVLVAAAQLDRASYFDLLMVKPGSDRKALQAAFHRFAVSFHPDQHRGEEAEIQEAAKRVFERGVEAYTVLRDPEFARYYQEQLAKGTRRLGASDFDRFAGRRSRRAGPPPAPAKKVPTSEESFVDQMQTEDGREVARRVEALIVQRRFRQAYLQMGLLETIEPNNAAVGKRADKIAAFLKRYGDTTG